MQFTVLLALVAGVSAASLSPRAECPATSGSACGTVTALGQSITYPECECVADCSGTVSFQGITGTVSLGVSS
ncbi:hypothetical protein K4F52_008600 [Lecanicillium sp. MT-2017a]|nr:hypothetical protein K4F52_008600 [Lecanicillium sp. MT-2017a]